MAISTGCGFGCELVSVFLLVGWCNTGLWECVCLLFRLPAGLVGFAIWVWFGWLCGFVRLLGLGVWLTSVG